jgi:hypothetical protein
VLTSKRTQAKNRKKREAYNEQRKVVYKRSNGWCEARWEGCTKVANHAHHMKRRSQGGKDEAENLLAVCAFCHDQIHRNPEKAFDKGHLVR